MDTARESASPFSSLFAGNEAAKVIDFLLSAEQHKIMAEIHVGTKALKPNNNKLSARKTTIPGKRGERQIYLISYLNSRSLWITQEYVHYGLKFPVDTLLQDNNCGY
jgi:hypothetical protein